MGTGLRLLLLWLLFFFYKSSPFLGTAPNAPPADRTFPAGLSLGLSRSALSHVTHLIPYAFGTPSQVNSEFSEKRASPPPNLCRPPRPTPVLALANA